MAIKLPKFKLNFNRLDARSRVFVLIGVIVGFVALIYLIMAYFSGGQETTGPSRVANVPQGLQSIPGGQLTQEYYRALQQANKVSAEKAQISGTSAVPTLVNLGGAQGNNQCVVCEAEVPDIKYNLEHAVRQGKITPEIANQLQQQANQNVHPDDFAEHLNKLIKEGKITPEEARTMLDQYQKQYANKLLDNSTKSIDALIKAGQLSLEDANNLINLQKDKISPCEYTARLQELVRLGKLPAKAAQTLTGQYTQQRTQDITAQSVASLRKMARNGEITSDVEKSLTDLEMKAVPMDTYSAALKKFVDDGKLTPVSAKKILGEFKEQKAALGSPYGVNQLAEQAEADAYDEIKSLLAQGKITSDVASFLGGLIQKDVPTAEQQVAVEQLVQQKKLTPEIAKLKVADYQKVKGLKDLSQKLMSMQENNASGSAWADELKRGVGMGLLTPDEAAQLMQEYQCLSVPPATTTAVGKGKFAELQQRVQEGPGAPATTATPAQFQVPVTVPPTGITPPGPPTGPSQQDQNAQINSIMGAMYRQAGQLVTSWASPSMVHREGDKSAAQGEEKPGTKPGGETSSTKPGENKPAGPTGPPIIKAGTVYFAVLDTAINSDYPDSHSF